MRTCESLRRPPFPTPGALCWSASWVLSAVPSSVIHELIPLREQSKPCGVRLTAEASVGGEKPRATQVVSLVPASGHYTPCRLPCTSVPPHHASYLSLPPALSLGVGEGRGEDLALLSLGRWGIVTFQPHRWSTQGAGSWALVPAASVRWQRGSCSGRCGEGRCRPGHYSFASMVAVSLGTGSPGQSVSRSVCVATCVYVLGLCSVSTSVHVWAVPTRLLEPLAL